MARRRAGVAGVLAPLLVAASCSEAAGPAQVAHLEFEGTPGVVGSGAGFSPPVMVMVRDGDDALASGWTEEVSLSLVGEGASLQGATTALPVGGVAAFHDLTLVGAGSGLRLVASSGSLPDVTSGAFDVPGRFSAASLTSGAYHTCALDADGRAYCWGLNADGQVGDGTTVDRPRPTAVAGGLRFAALSAEGSSTCGLTLDRTVYCWGRGDGGQVGTGLLQDATTPTAVALPGTVVQVDAGYDHTCALADDGTAYCWGMNYTGHLGTGSAERVVASPEAVTGGPVFTSITVGYEHTCGLTSLGEAYCWGRNSYGQLGDGTRLDGRSVPNPVLGGRRFSSLVAGGGPCHGETCGIALDGTAYCWGKNYQPTLASSWERYTLEPVAVEGNPGFVELVPGPLVVCGLDAEGALRCWGDAMNGQLANGSTAAVQEPTPVMPGVRIVSVAMGFSHICVAAEDGATWCWGENTSWQLGNPSNLLGWMYPVPVWAPTGG